MGKDRNLKNDVMFIIDTLREAGYRYLTDKTAEVFKKGKYDLVTETDRQIEDHIKRMIHKHYPKDIVIGEEYSPNDKPGKVSWTVDPIDGSVNYAHGMPYYGIQVAILNEEEVVAAVIYLPEIGKAFWAIKGQGTYETYDGNSNKRLVITRHADIESAVIHVGDITHDNEKLRKKEFEMMEVLSDKVSKVRMFGASSCDFLSVANGRADAYVIFTENLWDICPGMLICSEAGAIVTNTEGKPHKFGDDGVVAASNRELYNVIIEALGNKE